MVIQAALRSLIEDRTLSGADFTAALEEIMGGAATPAQIGAFLAALRVCGETPEMIAGGLGVMEKHAEPVNVKDVVDICGTGGDGIDTFNVSTAAGFVVAAAGARVAKHGNRAASSKCGSADVLEALGAKIDLGGEQVAHAINECGFAFLFAQRFHTAMRHVGGPRREIGVRTVFNLLGPLSNPARPRAQLVGVGANEIGPLVAQTLLLRGMPRAMVVHSAEGLDEISTAGVTYAWQIEGGALRERELQPSDFGLPTHPLSAVAGGNPEQNAGTMLAVMDGADGAVTDFVVMNAAAGCYIAGLANDLQQGAEMAKEAIVSGRAREVLDHYVALTRELSVG